MSGEEASLQTLPIDGITLWEGCMLALSVHGVMMPEYPFILNEHRWSSGIYLTQDSQGTKGAVVFNEERKLLLGLFRDFRSSRSKLALTEQYAYSHFRPAPEEIREMAEMLFLFFEAKSGEKTMPLVTTGFWSENGQIVSRDSYEEWTEHGGHVLSAQMMGFKEAMEYHKSLHSMDSRRADIAQRIYQERIRKPDGEVLLKKGEIEAISAAGPYNMGVCREIFRAFGVIFED